MTIPDYSGYNILYIIMNKFKRAWLFLQILGSFSADVHNAVGLPPHQHAATRFYSSTILLLKTWLYDNATRIQ